MIFVFVPYYGKWNGYFQKCLDRQTERFHLIKYNRKDNNAGWTRACNDFYREFQRFRGTEGSVVCIMNNDITFGDGFFTEGSTVERGEILIPDGFQTQIDWRTKSVTEGGRIDTFPGRAFFMTAEDFIQSDGFTRSLPHYLADLDFGYKMIRKGMRVNTMVQYIIHATHPVNANPWSARSNNNPLFWTIFLLRNGRNRYIFINLIKSWVELFRKSSRLVM